MVSPQIVDFIKVSKSAGVSDDDIRAQLLSKGWSQQDIDDSFVVFTNDPAAINTVSDSAYLISVSDLINGTVGVWQQHWRQLFMIVLIAQIPVFISVVLAYVGLTLGPEKLTHNPLSFGPVPFLVGGVVTIVGLAQFWMRAALIECVTFRDEGISATDAYGRSFKKLLSYFWVGLLAGFIVGGATLLFVVPGVIVGVWFTFGTYIVIEGGAKGFTALYRSRRYVEGFWSAVLGRMFLLGLLLGVVGWAYSFFANGVVALIQLIPKFGVYIVPVAGVVLDAVSLAIVTASTTIYSRLIYESLKQVKGDLDMEPGTGVKFKYLLISIVGVLLLFLLVGLIIALILRMFNELGTAAY
ncbi:hypothetical protein KC614_02790 [candidate division WWE3 bacterium]|uniref:Uncharacterized protein n=1 Tax=candidate division WWE3 bacterium TaxID=2053526 RepID=A0A955LKB0_UNCKA|nr:hypothetical protein [candidate division WWE3 bacterium]